MREKTRLPMNVPKFMVLFHLSFLILGLLSLFLMAIKVVSLDWSAFLIIVIAVLLNAFFEILWVNEAGRRRVEKPEAAPSLRRAFPMVSFVVPAYNNERDITQCINSLFKCAVGYRGPSEIIVVDDGSLDNTFDVAWAAINSNRREFMQVRATVVRHMTGLGKDEAVRAAANKTMGEYIAVGDSAVFCDPTWFNSLVDYMDATRKAVVSYKIRPRRGALAATPRLFSIYRADVLRRQLNEK